MMTTQQLVAKLLQQAQALRTRGELPPERYCMDPVKLWCSHMFFGPWSMDRPSRSFRYTYKKPDGKVGQGVISCPSPIQAAVIANLSIENSGAELLDFYERDKEEGCLRG